jgi:hypothetical protein
MLVKGCARCTTFAHQSLRTDATVESSGRRVSRDRDKLTLLECKASLAMSKTVLEHPPEVARLLLSSRPSAIKVV